MGLPFDRPVVIYSAGETHNIDATFLAWLLAGFGHRQVFVLDGGFFKWQLEQRPVVQEYPRLAETRFPSRAVPAGAGVAGGGAARRSAPASAILVDARPPDQYAGEAGAQMRQGHIPGAINHYWQDDLAREGFGFVWKPRAELRAGYEAQGITPDKDIIAYCNSATEASHVHFTLRIPAGVSAGAGVRGIVDGVGGAGGAADRGRERVEIRSDLIPSEAKDLASPRIAPFASLRMTVLSSASSRFPTAADPAATPCRRP